MLGWIPVTSSRVHGPWPCTTWLKQRLKIGGMGILSGLLNEENTSRSCITWHHRTECSLGQNHVCRHQCWAHSLCFHRREAESLKTLRRNVPFEFERIQLFGFIFCCYFLLFASSPGLSILVKSIWIADILSVLLWLLSGPIKSLLLGLGLACSVRAAPGPLAQGSRVDD